MRPIVKDIQKILKALDLYDSAARNGHVRSNSRLGYIYETGIGGLKKDFKKAKRFYIRAEKRGDLDARFNLALIYKKEKNFTKAARLFSLLVEGDDNDLDSKINLIEILEKGEGVPKNLRKVLGLLAQLAEKGDAEAQFRIGKMYRRGEAGIDVDLDRARDFLTLAVDKSHSGACFELGLMFWEDEVDGVTAEEAINLFTLAAEQGHAEAKLKLSLIYSGDERYEEAFRLCSSAAEEKYAPALNLLARFHEFGKGTPINHALAEKFYTLAAKQGDVSSELALASKYRNGIELRKNPKKALRLYKSASKKYENFKVDVAEMLRKGEGVIPKAQKARLMFYDIGRKKGNAVAIFSLAEMLRKGEGGKKNLQKARFFYSLAHKKKHRGATFQLAEMYRKGEGGEKLFEESKLLYESAGKRGHELAAFYAALFEGKDGEESINEADSDALSHKNSDSSLSAQFFTNTEEEFS